VSETLLHVECRHRFGKREEAFALDVRLVAGGGVTAISGPSGSGKSTLLGIIAGHLRPGSGWVHLAGRDLVDTRRGLFVPPHRRRIGMVYQDHLLFPHLTVRGNLCYGQARAGGAGTIERLDRVADVLELRDLLDRMPHTLSGGEKQRTALGRALLSGPELLLLDEPLGALDSARKHRIIGYLRRVLEAWSIPTLLVSHDDREVRDLADAVIYLEAGRVTPGPRGRDRAEPT